MAADSSRLVPPHSLEATEADGIYDLHDIIPKTEWKAIDVSPFDSSHDPYSRRAWMPVNRILGWRETHLATLSDHNPGKEKKKKTL